jgi:HAD superfamily hydrolase (TIGR01549 family)
MTVTAVLFDLDGTLAEFNLDYKGVRAEAKLFLTKEGIPASLFSQSESIFKMLEKAWIYTKNNDKDENFPEIRKRVLSIAEKHELLAARSTSILPGALETLKSLRRMKLKLAVFTINGTVATKHILNSFRLNKYFDAVVTRDDTSRVKPDPLHLFAALEILGVDPKEVVIVGDSIADMKCAAASGILGVGMETGVDSANKLKRAGALYTLKSLTRLPALIAKLDGANQTR